MYTKEEIKEAGLDDFRVFLAQVWDFLGLPDPTPVQYDMAYRLQHGPRRQIVMAFRGVGKSWVTVAFALWNLLLDPQKKIMVVSASQTLADDASKFARQIILGMEMLYHLNPRLDQRASALAFDCGPASPSKDPSLKSAGITGQITGSRADLIISDDVEIPKNSYTHIMREKLSELVKEYDAILKPDGRIVYLGTPQVEATLYNRLIKRGYDCRIWTAQVPISTEKYAGRLAPFITDMIANGIPAGTPVDPGRFDQTDLDERYISYGASGYALQFMLDTSPAEADKHPLKTKDLIIHDVDPDMAHVKLVWGSGPEQLVKDLHSGGFDGDYYVRRAWASDEMAGYQGTVCAIDPSARGKDETGFAIVKYAHGMLYLCEVGGYTDGFAEDTLKALAAKMAHWNVNYYIIERNYGGGMFDQLLKPHVLRVCKASPDEDWKSWSVGMKEQRLLDVMEPLVQAHRLVVDRRVIEKDMEVQADTEAYSFIQQMTRMARLKGCLAHEDRLEAVAMACGYWTERMDRDTEKVLDRHKTELLDAEIHKFMDHVLGFETNPYDSWNGDR